MHWLSQPHNWCGSHFLIGGPLGILVFFLFLAGVIYLGVKLVRAVWPRQSVAGSSGLGILQRRYAAGEIDEETYLKMKQELRS